MIVNKKILVGICLIVLVVILGIGVLTCFRRDSKSSLPIVSENQEPPTSTHSASPTPTPEIDYSEIQLPPSDNKELDNLTVPEEEAAVNNEEALSEQIAYEKERGEVIPELTPEQIAEENKRIEQAKKEAAANPEVQEPFGEPFEIEETQPEPKKDKDGYIYTKEEAVEIFRTEFQKLIDANDFNYTYARDSAIGKGRSTPEEFEADLKQLLTDPYSSEWLARAFDYFRQYGHIGILIGESSMWLAAGGDDAEWSESYTQ